MVITRITKIVDFIEYDGIRFYRDKKGYWLSEKVGSKNHPKRLHVYVWEKYNGPVLKDHHIHHIDHNTDNNEIENLVMLSQFDHLSLHGQIESNKAISRKNIAKAQQKSVEWHKSAKGKEWHAEHYEEMKDKLHTKINLKCLVCGKEVTVNRGGTVNKFCSNNCKSKYRRDLGLDNITSICVLCGKEFTKNKYSKAAHCSKSCTCKANGKLSSLKRKRDENGRFI